MPYPLFAVRPGDVDYGHVCPLCAGPKHRQSRRCAACYRDWLLAGNGGQGRLYGPDNPAYRHGRYVGGAKPSRAKPDPQRAPAADHPWRRQADARVKAATR